MIPIPYDPPDLPCDVCGLEAGSCICPECPACGERGELSCYREGNPLALVAVPLHPRWVMLRQWHEERLAQAKAMSWIEEGVF